MYIFTKTIVSDVLKALKAPSVLEIGADLGYSTDLLIRLTEESGGRLQVIDPNTRLVFDQPNVTHFRKKSLECLDDIEPIDCALIDGDHNWYTVYHELQKIVHLCVKWQKAFPITFIHDTQWPYGNRDMYYDPLSIPAEFIQPNEKKGLSLIDSKLVENGLNSHLNNAIDEGGPKNGVRTAVLDFLSSHSSLEFFEIKGFHGLGIICHQEVFTKNPSVRTIIESYLGAPSIQNLIEEIELDRLQKQCRLARSLTVADGLSAKLEKVEKRLDTLQNEFELARQKNKSLRADIRRLTENPRYKLLSKLRVLD